MTSLMATVWQTLQTGIPGREAPVDGIALHSRVGEPLTRRGIFGEVVT